VILHGTNLDYSFGGIFCKFGDSIVEAEIIRQGMTVVCYTPPQDEPQVVDVMISLNNKENFHASNSFVYLP
jgi:hypothetical protein